MNLVLTIVVNIITISVFARAIKGSDAAVRATGEGQGGRNWVNGRGANHWEENTGHQNHKWLVLEGAWDGNPQVGLTLIKYQYYTKTAGRPLEPGGRD